MRVTKLFVLSIVIFAGARIAPAQTIDEIYKKAVTEAGR
jgi:hypothetical protein